MSARAVIETDYLRDGVKVAIVRDYGGRREVLQWSPVVVKTVTEDDAGSSDPADWLALPQDVARALYESLADHFGHAGHDIRSLRKDYDAERVRVDRLIGNLINGGAS